MNASTKNYIFIIFFLNIFIVHFSSNNISGMEFHVNTFTTDEQEAPSVTSNGTNYLVTWESNRQINTTWDIFGQLISPSGEKIGGEFSINSWTTDQQENPSVASNGENYLVTWDSLGQDANASGIYGQMIDLYGNKIGLEFQLNTYARSYQSIPSVASDGTNYLVTWQSNTQDESGYGIFGRRINSLGSMIDDSEFIINEYTTLSQQYPCVASNGTNYLVAWHSQNQDSDGLGIYGRIVGSSGSPEFQINSYIIDDQKYPSVASIDTNYLVTWHSTSQDGYGYGIYGQLISSSGNKIGDEFLINSYTTSHQCYSSVASVGNNYLVTWQSYEQDGSSWGIYGQLISSSGNKIAEEFQMNSYALYSQEAPSVAANGNNFFATWQSENQDGSYNGIYGTMIDMIPEPTSWVLLFGGLIGMLLRVAKKCFEELKRIIDILLSIIFLILLSPVSLILMAGIKLTSPGHAIFSQIRVGKEGKLFTMYKFRSMGIDAEKQTGPTWTTENDTRVTPIGAFMRKTHLDEIPQFINVIKGDMSIVGPRPERPYFVNKLQNEIPDYLKRLQVLPGITGLAQVCHKSDANIEDVRIKLLYDLEYIKKYYSKSWSNEFKIMFFTVIIIFIGRTITL